MQESRLVRKPSVVLFTHSDLTYVAFFFTQVYFELSKSYHHICVFQVDGKEKKKNK